MQTAENFFLVAGVFIFAGLLPEYLAILSGRVNNIPVGQNILSGLAAVFIATWHILGA